jgi:hypothetical protein
VAVAMVAVAKMLTRYLGGKTARYEEDRLKTLL